jgi:hypothetical protein
MLEVMGFMLAISVVANIVQMLIIVENQAYQRGYQRGKQNGR